MTSQKSHPSPPPTRSPMPSPQGKPPTPQPRWPTTAPMIARRNGAKHPRAAIAPSSPQAPAPADGHRCTPERLPGNTGHLVAEDQQASEQTSPFGRNGSWFSHCRAIAIDPPAPRRIPALGRDRVAGHLTASRDTLARCRLGGTPGGLAAMARPMPHHCAPGRRKPSHYSNRQMSDDQRQQANCIHRQASPDGRDGPLGRSGPCRLRRKCDKPRRRAGRHGNTGALGHHDVAIGVIVAPAAGSQSAGGRPRHAAPEHGVYAASLSSERRRHQGHSPSSFSRIGG